MRVDAFSSREPVSTSLETLWPVAYGHGPPRLPAPEQYRPVLAKAGTEQVEGRTLRRDLQRPAARLPHRLPSY